MSEQRAQHTPGPWRASGPPAHAKYDQQGDRLIRPVGGEDHIAEVFQYRGDNAQDCETSLANARLIAAAPDLLSVLINIKEHKLCSHCTDAAYAAIAKATTD